MYSMFSPLLCYASMLLTPIALYQLVSGLHEIHRHGYIHRDIKCDNIFLTQETNECVIGMFFFYEYGCLADHTELFF